MELKTNKNKIKHGISFPFKKLFSHWPLFILQGELCLRLRWQVRRPIRSQGQGTNTNSNKINRCEKEHIFLVDEIFILTLLFGLVHRVLWVTTLVSFGFCDVEIHPFFCFLFCFVLFCFVLFFSPPNSQLSQVHALFKFLLACTVTTATEQPRACLTMERGLHSF